MSGKKSPLGVTREENYPDWYQAVVQNADLAEHASVRGCMIIKPWGFGIWEKIRDTLDAKIKETGHQNVYFPLLIPLSYFEKEAKHIEGFAKEMAMVTHTKLTERDGKLEIDGELEEPLVIRPTSETAIAEAFSRWIQSYRDLPVKINQWANVMRWEMRTRLFLRTSEFLWQEGHTAHASAEEAIEETETMLGVYQDLIKNHLAIPVFTGPKSADERFPGAEETYTLEAMMQDGRALQMGTSHYLGETFSRSEDIQFQDSNGDLKYAHTTSWGVSTRLMGGLIMVHSDDTGLRVPPAIAPDQIVIIPILKDNAQDETVLSYAAQLRDDLKTVTFRDQPVRVGLDDSPKKFSDKKWEWIKKGTPIVVEVGSRDVEKNNVAVRNRWENKPKADFMGRDAFIAQVSETLETIQSGLYKEAKERMDKNTATDITTPDAFEEYCATDNAFIDNEKKSPGFVRAPWSGDIPATLEILDPLKVTIRCLPLEQRDITGQKCVVTGQPATTEAIFARAY